LGTLNQHLGEITCLDFYKYTHFISGGDDNTICIWRTKDWECLKVLNGHKLSINSISIHPSGRVALSISKDRGLRLWNLLDGRSAYHTSLDFDPEIVKWSPDGVCYVIVSSYKAILYSLEGERVSEFQTQSYERINDIVFLENEIIAFGGEDNKISCYNITKGELLLTVEGFENRIKGLSVIPKPSELCKSYKNLLVSLCSDRKVTLWDFDISHTTPLSEHTIDGRVTCITASYYDAPH